LLGLPELDTEVDDLTQYNMAHNRQISMVGISENEKVRKRKYRPHSVSFSDSEEIINPEDVDPSVGKFRNMVQTTILPSKKRKTDNAPLPPSSLPPLPSPPLGESLPPPPSPPHHPHK
jgi:nuclear inhibitor of protein phosphatase 1